MPTPDSIRDAVAAYARLFNDGDREAWLDHWAADATLEDPVGTPVRTGRAEIGEFWDLAHSLAQGIELQVLEPFKVAGNEAAFVLRIVTDLGDTKMFVDVIEIQRYDEDGKLAAMRAFWSPEEMAPYGG
ncbi:MAG: nuclear transport factor 2 family protein [Acidimicrobiales bacterium]|nr:nuclear transport factor 2 family protein [Acidimicrobiales bacterium]